MVVKPIALRNSIEIANVGPTTGTTGVLLSSGGDQIVFNNYDLVNTLYWKYGSGNVVVDASNNTDLRRFSLGPGQSGVFSRGPNTDRAYLWAIAAMTATGARDPGHDYDWRRYLSFCVQTVQSARTP